MKEDILQELIDGGGKYFVANRYVEGAGAARGKDEWQALIIAPDIPRELWGLKIMDMPYKDAKRFMEAEIKTIIHLGKTYQPFQYGIRNKDFISLKEVTCPPMELIVKCYQDDIKDYYKVVELMETLTPNLLNRYKGYENRLQKRI